MQDFFISDTVLGLRRKAEKIQSLLFQGILLNYPNYICLPQPFIKANSTVSLVIPLASSSLACSGIIEITKPSYLKKLIFRIETTFDKNSAVDKEILVLQRADKFVAARNAETLK